MHLLFDAVMLDRPSGIHSITYFTFYYSNNKLMRIISYPLLYVVNQLLCTLAKVNINTLCLRLQHPVFVYQNKSHPSQKLRLLYKKTFI